MKKVLPMLVPLMIAYTMHAQSVVAKKWDARFGGAIGDELYVISQTPGGGYVAGGSSMSGISGNKTQTNWDTSLQTSDYWIVKTDGNGNYQWDKRFGGMGDDAFMTLCVTKDGGLILGGFSASGSSGDKTQNSWGGYDYWVIKLDSLGNKQWDGDYGGTNDDILDKVIQTKDGGYILAGFSSSGISGDKSQPNWDTTESTADYWVVKIDSAGNKQWDKRFGGTLSDDGRDIIQTPDGGYLLGGTSASDSSGDKSQNNFGPLAYPLDNYWVVKMDSLGNKQWDKVYGGVLGEEFSTALNTSDGNYMLSGTSYDGVSGDKTSDSCGYWLVKIDMAGNKLGDWAYGNCGTMYGMSGTSDDGYLLTGVSGEILTIKTDSQMNVAWERASPLAATNFTQAACALQSKDGCYIIGVKTSAGIGGDKTQPNWDPTNQTLDYWIVEYCDSFPLGIQEPEGAMHLLVYPNPASGDLYINIQKDNLTEASFTLTDPTGEAVYQNTADRLTHSYTKILDLSKLPAGVYMLDVTVDGERLVKKVVKE